MIGCGISFIKPDEAKGLKDKVMLSNLKGICAYISAQNGCDKMSVGFSHFSRNDNSSNFQNSRIEQEISKYFQKIEQLKKMS